MAAGFGRDFISELPPNVTQLVLTKLPIKDAVRTSILSRRWRNSWGSLKDLVFDDRCATHDANQLVVENRLQNFVTCFLLLHNAPISLFSLRTAYLETSPRVHQWLLFLSRRKDVNEIVLELGANDWYKLPTSLFFCKELRRLELVRFQLKTPPEFRGFLRLKELKLQQIISPNFDVESLIFSCPVLESLEFSYFSNLLDVYMPSPGDADFESLKAKLPSHGVFTHLKNVEMTDILAVPRELNFIKYLLKYTPALKVMSVKMSHYVPERRTELAEEIVNYLCISTHMVLTVD